MHLQIGRLPIETHRLPQHPLEPLPPRDSPIMRRLAQLLSQLTDALERLARRLDHVVEMACLFGALLKEVSESGAHADGILDVGADALDEAEAGSDFVGTVGEGDDGVADVDDGGDGACEDGEEGDWFEDHCDRLVLLIAGVFRGFNCC